VPGSELDQKTTSLIVFWLSSVLVVGTGLRFASPASSLRLGAGASLAAARPGSELDQKTTSLIVFWLSSVRLVVGASLAAARPGSELDQKTTSLIVFWLSSGWAGARGLGPRSGGGG